METFFLHAGDPTALELAQRIHMPSGTALPEGWNGKAVIHWGTLQGEQKGDFTVQPVQSMLRAQDRSRREKLLQLHGVKTPASHLAGTERHTFPYKYKIAVFHLQAIAVYEKKEKLLLTERSGYEADAKKPVYAEVQPDAVTFHARRAMREAVKAIYALGLDYGLVTLGILPSGHTLVLDVDPAPKLTGKLLQRFAEALNRFEASLAQELQRKDRAMLGSDPEFLLLSRQGKVVSASRFFTREGAVGCDAIVLSGHRVILPLAELRPQPSRDPRELTRNLHRTMQLAARAIDDESLAWLSGGMPLKGFPLGGHIHFSGVWLNSFLLRALDHYLALPLMQIEGPTTADRRPRYGFLGDFRRQFHGGFEYRTLPSWMLTPAIANGVLALASLIADNYWHLRRRPLEDTALQAAYYRGDKSRLRIAVDSLWRDLEQLQAYGLYASSLKPLKKQIDSMTAWDEKADIRKAWKIPPFHRKEAIERQIML